MKGVIFNFFERFIVDATSEEMYEDIVDSTMLETKEEFIGPGTYPDSDLIALATTASQKLKINLGDAIEKFGFYLLGGLAQKFPIYFENSDLFKFIESLDDTIHVEVRKLWTDAVTPKFETKRLGDSLQVIYRSERRLCRLMLGLINGAAKHFNEPIEIEHLECYSRGNDRCKIMITKI